MAVWKVTVLSSVFSSFSSWTLFDQETKKQLNVQHLMQLPLSLVSQKQQQAQKKKVRLLQEKAKQNNNKKNAYTRKCCARIQISWTVCLAHVCIFRSDPRHRFSSFFGVHNKKVSFLMIVNYDFQFLCQLLLAGTGRATCFFFSPDRAKASSELYQKQIITWKKVNLLKKKNKQTKKLPEFKVICSMCIIL